MLPPLQAVHHPHHTTSGSHHQRHEQHHCHPYGDNTSDLLVEDLAIGGGSASARLNLSSSTAAPYDPPHSATISSGDHRLQHQQQHQQHHQYHQHPHQHLQQYLPHLPPMPSSPYGARSDGSPSQATSSEYKLGKDGLPKKKRKQLVACDSCRLRRVKCDKAEMGGGDCSECLKKHIKCTDAYVKSKPKVIRSGKLIQQAKKLYGNGEDGGSGDERQPEAAGEEMESNEDFDGLLYVASNAIQTSAESAATGAPDHGSPPPPTAPPLSLVTGPQSRIISTQLGLAVQDHLVQTYYTVFQVQMHVVDWPVFQQTWDNAGRNAAAMSPTNECLAVVIQAWAARFSDHPVVLGQEGALTLPTLNDIRHHNGQDFTDVGNRREPFARAMLDRALQVCDERGALRKASAACCTALLLLEFLMVWDNSGRAPSSAGRSMMVNCAEHLRSINEPSYVSADPDEVVVPSELISGGTLLWTMYTRDALTALMRSQTLCLTDEDLAGLSDLLAIQPHASEIMATVSSENPQMLLGLAVVCVFRHLTNSIRTCAKAIAGPLARRMRLNEAAVREEWSDLDQSVRYTAIFKESVNRMDWTSFPTAKAHAWFRDVTVMQAQIALAVHSVVLERWTLESCNERSLARDPTYAGYVDMLHQLKCESDERLLTCIREVTKYYRGVNHSVVFEGLLSSEFMKDYLQHLLRSPTWEEGGPATWTWEDKQLNCDDAIKVLRNGGWCWPGYDVVIVDAMRHLADEGARIEQLQRRRTGSTASNPGPLAPNHGGAAGYTLGGLAWHTGYIAVFAAAFSRPWWGRCG
ncbi:hypothetical protein MVLG_00754 [Microbotryum lychnidis-dioicae p1A1 Lamole]|uniref:Zn(2)-C6 fungal-type domain-containing protein n=1 Tax=Microbotryum lychnidis-dioicae (strain p1A1 Lamole / MvSl-1064) TaxID=683840 RepID=U5H013_USTV1|nr:hypothetical protein MVLG_00754 [Microbotryum lychnidis-dioicae p1A1 Lamole]|eukprot:KDE09035.1 hypothetical protein MVLG_00754 [Microbotryum lychnidis-dioicae p1A1 Lamole]